MATLAPLLPTATMDSERKGKEAPSPASAGGLQPSSKAAGALANANISSPHELTDWVDSVLDQLETRFDSMSGQVESRMKEMSDRIDALESSIEELITGVSAPLSSAKTTADAEAVRHDVQDQS